MYVPLPVKLVSLKEATRVHEVPQLVDTNTAMESEYVLELSYGRYAWRNERVALLTPANEMAGETNPSR